MSLDPGLKAIREGAAFLRVPGTSILELEGRDRVRFLHNLCTNDIYKLATGQDGGSFGKGAKVDLARTRSGVGCFAATVNRQGKMVAAYKVRMGEDCLQLEVPGGAKEALKAELEKAIIMDQVTIRDAGEDYALFHVAGPKAAGVVSTLGPVDAPEFHFRDRDTVVVSPFRWVGEAGFDIIVPGPKSEETRHLLSLTATLVPFDGFNSARIENGWPRWGVDMGPDDLPMEAGLDPIAISYSKGCYLGQEVIQRLKTYSEPPRQLVSLQIEGDRAPAAGAIITSEGVEIGRVTSAAMASRPVAMGYVKKTHKAPGTRVDAGGIPATVKDLPWHRAPTGNPPPAGSSAP